MHLTHKFLNKYLFKCPLLALLNAPLIFSFSHHTYVNCLQIYKYIYFFFHYFVLTGYTRILLKKKIENRTKRQSKQSRLSKKRKRKKKKKK